MNDCRCASRCSSRRCARCIRRATTKSSRSTTPRSTIGTDEIVALVGPSGSGKTTLCSIAGGILSPTEGTVVVGGDDISGYSQKQLTDFRREHVGFVFQTVNLVPFLTARENLLVVDEIGRRTGAPARARADQLLEELGLADRGDHLPSSCPAGNASASRSGGRS